MGQGVLHETSSAERAHFSAVLTKANPSIHLIGKCCVLHESWRLSPCTFTRAALPKVSFKAMYILRTHLLENPNVSFYYKDTAIEKGVPFALNTIVGFEPSDALQFDDKKTAIALCKKLNLETSSLARVGYSEFEVCSLGI